MKKYIIPLISFILALSSCSKKDNDFIGHWQDTKKGKILIEIQENGDSFTLKRIAKSSMSGKYNTKTYPAIMIDQVLEVSIGSSTVKFSVDKSSGYLIDGRGEYKKIDQQSAIDLSKEFEKEELKAEQEALERKKRYKEKRDKTLKSNREWRRNPSGK